MDTAPHSPLTDLPFLTARQLRAYLTLLRKIRAALATFYSAFPREPLGESERNTLSPFLFPDAQEFVTLLARAVAARPGLFRHIPLDPELLSLRQQVADVLFGLRCHLERLHRLSGDAYIQAQAGTIGDARDVITRVRQEGALLYNPDPDLEDRQLALRLPASLLPRRGRPPKKGRRR